MDRALSAAGLVLLAPLLLAVDIAVRVTGPGSVLYRQTRVAINGEHFRLLKFRSMRDGASADLDQLRQTNEHDGPLSKLRRDPRVTPIGGFLRLWSLDELPRLWTVAKGGVSMVGPRPPLALEVEKYGPDVHRRMPVKPGITGWWQI